MKTYVASGKTVEDAISHGLTQLNCSLGDVEIEVLESGSKGLFGMFGKNASVKLTVKEDDEESVTIASLMKESAAKPARVKETPVVKPVQAVPAAVAPIVKPVQAAPAAAAPVAKPAPQPQAAKPTVPPVVPARQPMRVDFTTRRSTESKAQVAQAAAPVQSAPSAAWTKAPTAPQPQRRRPPRVEDEIQLSPMPTGPQNVLDMTQVERTAYEFLTELTRRMNVPVGVVVKEEGKTLRAAMSGDSMGILIGRRGDTLDAIQYLTSLQINKSHADYIRVSIDTENYREKREYALKQLASRMASRARNMGGRVALEPMNPYERRILHSTLQDHPFVTTHSEGDEPNRRVVITLK